MQHSSSTFRSNVAGFSYLGENLAICGRSACGTQGVDLWYDEIRYTNGGLQSHFTKQTGHYTAVVWKSTTTLGCGIYDTLLVCQYGPAGNYKHQFTRNVLRPVKTASQCAHLAPAGPTPTPTPLPRPGSPTPRPTPARNPTPTPTPLGADKCLAKIPSWRTTCKGKYCLKPGENPDRKMGRSQDNRRWEDWCQSSTSATCTRTDAFWCRGQCNCPRQCPHACGRCPPSGSAPSPTPRPAPSPTPSATTTGKQLQEANTRKCIRDDGGTLNFQTCNRGDPAQLWGVGPGGAYKNAKTGKCMVKGSYAC